MNKVLNLVMVLFCLMCISNNAQAQVQTDSTTESAKQFHKITMYDGRVYIAELISDDGREVLIETKELGKIYLNKSEIESIEKIDNGEALISGKYREAGPFVSRYYFTNNALPITKGEDYAMIHLYGPEVHFALSDKFSLGIMATWAASPIGLAAKYSFKTSNEKLNLSLGTIMLSSGYFSVWAPGWGGLHWGSLTYGTPSKNITASAGFGYMDFGFGDRNRFESGLERMNSGLVFSIAGMTQVGRKASFLFDSMTAISQRRNYSAFNVADGTQIVTYEAGPMVSTFLMPGMRFQKNENRAFQVALAGVIQYSSIGLTSYNSDKFRAFPVPMCSWLFKF